MADNPIPFTEHAERVEQRRPYGSVGRAHPEQVAGFVPVHLDSTVRPAELEPRFRPTRRLEHDLEPGLQYATCLFPPEDGDVFSDTSFPWCTCGKVEPSGARVCC